MIIKIYLSTQEVEFAAAYKQFLSERDPAAGAQIAIDEMGLAIPEDEAIKNAFVNYGLARLLKVMYMAIRNEAIPPTEVPDLVSSLSQFSDKLANSLRAKYPLY